jgi:hypothetical protein
MLKKSIFFRELTTLRSLIVAGLYQYSLGFILTTLQWSIILTTNNEEKEEKINLG